MNRGVASRRSRAGGVGSIPGGTGSARDREDGDTSRAEDAIGIWANFKFVSIFAADDFKLLSLLLPQNPATALAAHARARKLAG